MAITSLENLEFNEHEKKIVPAEPEGAEVSTFVQWQDDVTGEITTTDKRIPRLNIGQKSGALGESLGFGNLILNKEIILSPFGQSIHLMVLKIRKQYQERREYDPANTTMPRMFNTAKEALAAGFCTEYVRDEKMALPVAQILFLIPAPASMDPDMVEQHFPYRLGDIYYTPAAHITSPTSYAETAKPIFTAMDTAKVKELGIRSVRWLARVEKRINAKNSWFILKLVASGFNPPELMNYSKEVLP